MSADDMKNKTEKLSILIALVCTAVGFLYVMVFKSIDFYSIDDKDIQNALSGLHTGVPYITHQFINVCLGIVISSLYRLLPSIQWWFVYSVTVQFISIYVMIYFAIKISTRLRVRTWLMVLAVALLEIVYYVPTIRFISFTFIPANECSAAIALLLGAVYEENKRKRDIYVLLSYVFYFAAIIHREDTAIAGLGYFLLAYFYYTMKSPADIKKKAVRIICAAISICCMLFFMHFLNSIVKYRLNGEYFVEFNSGRLSFIDYPVDTYEENPELYQSVGWDRYLYDLASRSYFADERITADAFKTISSGSRSEIILSKDWVNRRKEIIKECRDDVQIQLILILAITLAILVLCKIKKENTYEILIFGLSILGTIVLAIYLVCTGRALYRGWYAFMLPLTYILFYILMTVSRDYSRFQRGECIILIMSIACMIKPMHFNPMYGYNSFERNSRATSIDTIYDAAINNPGNIYLIWGDAFENTAPGKTYTELKPVNVIAVGECWMHSDMYYKQMKLNELDELTADVFKKKNVFFAFPEDVRRTDGLLDNGMKFDYLFDYLRHGFGASDYIVTDIGNNVFLYSFVFE